MERLRKASYITYRKLYTVHTGIFMFLVQNVSDTYTVDAYSVSGGYAMIGAASPPMVEFKTRRVVPLQAELE